MKILFLATDAYGINGGIAKFNRDLIEAISSYVKCSEVIMLSIHSSKPAPKNLKLNYFPAQRKSKISYVLHSIKQSLTLRKHDVIICGHIHLIPVAYAAHLLSGAPIFLIVHGLEAWQKTASIITNILVKKINGYISVSAFTEKRFLAWAGLIERGYIFPNCVDIDVYTPGPKRVDLMERYHLKCRRVILTVARLASNERFKGIDEVLDVFSEILKIDDELTYLICGDGDDKIRFQEKVARLGLQDHVIFSGFIDESEKVDHYRLADVFVMPGKAEGFGIVYLEAMACGVPVIGSTLDGSQETLMQGRLGALVDPSNSRELKSAILEALNKPKLVPREQLKFFSFQSFEKRCHAFLERI